MDDLDRRMIALLRTNARLPLLRIAQALGIARSTAQLRLKALEDKGIVTGYTVSVSSQGIENGIRAIVMVAVDSCHEAGIIQELSKRHEVTKIYTVSGRYDLCAILETDNTEELDNLLNRIRRMIGVNDTFSTLILSTKLTRPD